MSPLFVRYTEHPAPFHALDTMSTSSSLISPSPSQGLNQSHLSEYNSQLNVTNRSLLAGDDEDREVIDRINHSLAIARRILSSSKSANSNNFELPLLSSPLPTSSTASSAVKKRSKAVAETYSTPSRRKKGENQVIFTPNEYQKATDTIKRMIDSSPSHSFPQELAYPATGLERMLDFHGKSISLQRCL